MGAATSTHQLRRPYTLSLRDPAWSVDIERYPSPIHVFHSWVTSHPDSVCCYTPELTHCDDGHTISYEPTTFLKLWSRCDRLYGYLRHNFTFLRDATNETTVALMIDDLLIGLHLTIALLRADVRVMVIDPAKSPKETQDLCRSCEVDVLVISPRLRNRYTATSRMEVNLLPELSTRILDSLPLSDEVLKPPREHQLSEAPVILHSSGYTLIADSSSQPRPIPQTNYRSLTATLYGAPSPESGSRVCQFVICPHYHSLFYTAVVIPLLCGTSIPILPAGRCFPPPPTDIIDTISAVRPARLITLPLVLEELTALCQRRPELWSIMQSVAELVYSGAHLNHALKSSLAKRRIRIRGLYGSTEFGPLLAGVFTKPTDATWMCPFPTFGYVMAPVEDVDDGVFEMIVTDDTPGFSESLRNCFDGHATRDLFVPVNGENMWAFHGRRDDTLVHLNGLRTNALAVESAIMSASNKICRAVVVGEGEAQPGVIIELKKSSFLQQREDAMSEVLRAIEIANKLLPEHSHVYPDMVHILPSYSRIPLSHKGNVDRGLVSTTFAREIDAFYGRDRGIPTSSIVVDLKQSPPTAQQILEVLSDLLNLPPEELNSSLTLFDLGMTSQMALAVARTLEHTFSLPIPSSLLYQHSRVQDLFAVLSAQLLLNKRGTDDCRCDGGGGGGGTTTLLPRKSILTSPTPRFPFDVHCRHSPLPTKGGGINFQSAQSVYDFYSAYLDELASEVTNRRRERAQSMGSRERDRARKKINPRRCDSTPNSAFDDEGDEEVVLISGVTGSLGSHIVQTMLPNHRFKKIYLLVRPGLNTTTTAGGGGGGASHVGPRLRQLCLERGLDFYHTMERNRIEAVSYDLSTGFSGCDPQKVMEMRDEVTLIIHCAWRSNQNLPLEAYVNDCVRSVADLIRFAALGPKGSSGSRYDLQAFKRRRICFISSMTTVHSCPETLIQPTVYLPAQRQLRMTLDSGYSLSKSIGELLLHRAHCLLGLKVRIFRMGIIGGDTHYGIWPVDNFAALLTMGGTQLHMMPELSLDCSIVPVNIAASCITEVLDAETMSAKEDRLRVYHIRNPRAASWKDWLTVLRQAGLTFDVVSGTEFLARLASEPVSMLHQVDALMRRLYDNDLWLEGERHPPLLDIEDTLHRSPSLKTCPPVDKRLAELYIRYWGSLRTRRAATPAAPVPHALVEPVT